MYYYLYKITNTINDMIYVGVHRTEDMNDGYMGSGLLLIKAKKKYGYDAFSKEVLEMFDTADDMFEMESTFVNQEFINSKQTYNIMLGGSHGPQLSKTTEYYKSGEHIENAKKASVLGRIKQQENKSNRIREYDENPTLCKYCDDPLPYDKKRNKFCDNSCAATFNNTGRVVTEAHKAKVSRTMLSKNI